MTATTFPPDEAALAADEAHAWTMGLADMAVYIQVHPGIRLPRAGGLSLPLQGGTRGQLITDLEVLAGQWGGTVEEREDRQGRRSLVMERWFGPVRVHAALRAEEQPPFDADAVRAFLTRLPAPAASAA